MSGLVEVVRSAMPAREEEWGQVDPEFIADKVTAHLAATLPKPEPRPLQEGAVRYSFDVPGQLDVDLHARVLVRGVVHGIDLDKERLCQVLLDEVDRVRSEGP